MKFQAVIAILLIVLSSLLIFLLVYFEKIKTNGIYWLIANALIACSTSLVANHTTGHF